MSNSNFEWSKFIKRISINAPLKTVYKAWTTQAGLEKWFLRSALFTMPDGNLRAPESEIQKGDKYEWTWHGWCDDVIERNEVFEVNGKDLLKFGFAKSCLVTISLSEFENETVVELKQENIPTDETSKINYHLGCMEGWTFYLVNLKSVLQHGNDLRNKNLNLHNVINA